MFNIQTVSNILVPLQIVYRNESMKVEQYSSKANKDQQETQQSQIDLSPNQKKTEKTRGTL